MYQFFSYYLPLDKCLDFSNDLYLSSSEVIKKTGNAGNALSFKL